MFKFIMYRFLYSILGKAQHSWVALVVYAYILKRIILYYSLILNASLDCIMKLAQFVEKVKNSGYVKCNDVLLKRLRNMP